MLSIIIPALDEAATIAGALQRLQALRSRGAEVRRQIRHRDVVRDGADRIAVQCGVATA